MKKLPADSYEANNQSLASMTKLYFRTVFSGSDFLFTQYGCILTGASPELFLR